MQVVASAGREDIARVYIAEMRDGRTVEFVESVQPPIPREKKWVLIVSTLFGCPVGCPMCDAGGEYKGKLSKEEILEQIDYLVRRRFPDGTVPVEKFKVQFARMGEPAFNPAVLEVLDELPRRYEAPGLLPSLSTVAPYGTDGFFEGLLDVKRRHYRGRFQLQFSVHSTDPEVRDRMIPVWKWRFEEIASYGERFFEPGDRKITLNFALAKGILLEARVLSEYFSPERFLIKITPLNPTYRAVENGLSSYIDPNRPGEEYGVVQELRAFGYDVIVSIGEVEENRIGSNCGQFLRRHMEARRPMKEGYTYPLEVRS